MSGLYNALMGFDHDAPVVLRMLDLQPEAFGRFRDAWIGNNELCVYTRCGGGNRPDHETVFTAIEAHPLFLRAVDDTNDNTYCTFYFRVPEAHREHVARYVEKFGAGKTGDERWAAALKGLGALP